MEVYPREPRWALNPSPRRPSSETRQRQLSTDSAEHQRLASPRSAVSPLQDSSHGRDARYGSPSAADEAARTQRALEEATATTLRRKKRLRQMQRLSLIHI